MPELKPILLVEDNPKDVELTLAQHTKAPVYVNAVDDDRWSGARTMFRIFRQNAPVIFDS